MPWTTPTLPQVRQMTRDYVTGALRGAVLIPNSVLRIMSDAMSGLAALVLLYIDWLSQQLLPDTAEDAWLERWADLYLVNADGSKGRKGGTVAVGTVVATGTFGKVIPNNSPIDNGAGVSYVTTQEVTLDGSGTVVPVVAVLQGADGNQVAGTTMSFSSAISGIDGIVTVIEISQGSDPETIPELRARQLARMAQPPMGGDAEDYVAWAKEVGGVTRAWCSPNEMGIGTCTVRFMMDQLRAGTLVNGVTSGDNSGDEVNGWSGGGLPEPRDIAQVLAYLNTKRPVTVADFYVEAPIPFPVNYQVRNLETSTAANLDSVKAALQVSVAKMINYRSAPGYAVNGVTQPAQTIFREWVSDAILNTTGVVSFDLGMSDTPMPDNGHMAVPGVCDFE